MGHLMNLYLIFSLTSLLTMNLLQNYSLRTEICDVLIKESVNIFACVFVRLNPYPFTSLLGFKIITTPHQNSVIISNFSQTVKVFLIIVCSDK